MTLIVDRAGSGAALTTSENDTNLDSLSGINVVETGTSLTIAATHQNDIVEFTNAGSVAVTLDLLATIIAAIDTTDFKVTLINTGAGTVTITPNGSNSINTGAATIVLKTDEYVTLQNDNTNLIWNIINSSTTINGVILDASGNEILELFPVASAVNHYTIFNSATGDSPVIRSEGEANIGIRVKDSNNFEILELKAVASAANYVSIVNSETGNDPIISAEGEDSKGIAINDSNGNELLNLKSVGSALNYLE